MRLNSSFEQKYMGVVSKKKKKRETKKRDGPRNNMSRAGRGIEKKKHQSAKQKPKIAKRKAPQIIPSPY